MTSFLADPQLVPQDEAPIYQRYISEVAGLAPWSDLLNSIPRPYQSSYGPFATLAALLEAMPHDWPVLELQLAYVDLWKLLPDNAKGGRAPPAAQALMEQVLMRCKGSYASMLDLYDRSSDRVALIDPETTQSVSHRSLHAAVQDFSLPLHSAQKQSKPVVAISLPNGLLLAMTVLATANYYTAAPVAHGSGVGKEQFKTDVLQSGSDLVLASAADVNRLGLRDAWLADSGIQVLTIELSSDKKLVTRDLTGAIITSLSAYQNPHPNTAVDTGILLFTSGTSGKKKLVPLSIHSMVCGVAMVVRSWGLSPSMRCLNQMPLNHVGGLIRNLFAPVISGGSVICCSAFDANLFWDCVEDFDPTWYYASPSMHQCILEAGADRPQSMAKSQIKLICNAAGGLLPSLAIQLRDAFSTAQSRCIVLPSYGMTECMPISTPPLNYQLEKSGTSGSSVGPEIGILDGRDQDLPESSVGRICIRGTPVFEGYLLSDGSMDESCFNADGWFDTGDMGYLDQDGFLYITGRSKEVINRGGELISPFEVEEAIVSAAAQPGSSIYGRVDRALAFSVAHDVLQEVVGIAVTTPSGGLRPDLRTIQESVKSALSQVKLPVVLVYMEGGLPTNNNKVLRIKLAERLGIPTMSDSTPAPERYFEASCPPPNTPLTTPISNVRMTFSRDATIESLREVVPSCFEWHIRRVPSDFCPEVILASGMSKGEITPAESTDAQSIADQLITRLDAYDMPLDIVVLEKLLPRSTTGDVDDRALESLLQRRTRHTSFASTMTATETVVSRVYAEVLSLPIDAVSPSSDFFDLGGDSMAAGRLLNALRKEFPIRLPINILFTNSQVAQLCRIIEQKLGKDKPAVTEKIADTEEKLLPGCEQTCSSTNPLLLILQLTPMVLFYPLKRALQWIGFIYFLSFTQYWETNNSTPGRLVDLVLALTVARAAMMIVQPLFAIVFKWLVAGRYREGIYPMWGSYHTRWWLTEKITSICGIGVFGLSNWTRVLFFRSMGARIGKNVSIAKNVRLGEWDLLWIGDDAVLESCTIRPFAAERNTSMYLGRIFIGANASVGLSSIVAAGTTVPANACIGPNSSSWEIGDADEANRDLSSAKIPGNHWALSFFLGFPMKLVATFIGALPWMLGLMGLVSTAAEATTGDAVRSTIIWFASPRRVAFHYLALVANAAIGPVFFFVTVLVFKRVFDRLCGPIIPSSVDGRSQMTKFRMNFFRSIMPNKRFHKVTELFGTHYNVTSVLARAMGAKVGQRVYWPGTGPTIQDWDLIDIGNDVVFGSRSHLVTSDGSGSNFVRVKSGAMVADRVVLLPGVELGEKTVMGSGALAKRGMHYPDGTTWVGSKGNEAVCLSADAIAGSSEAETVGRRAEAYHNTVNLPQGYSTFNSTSTTLVKASGSERSSVNLAKRPKSFSVRDAGFEEKHLAVDADGNFVDVRAVDEDDTSSDKVSTEEVSSSPFGRAFYEGKAPYRVWGQFSIFLYSTLIVMFAKVYWNAASISAIQIIGRILRDETQSTQQFQMGSPARPLVLFSLFGSLIMGIMTFQSILAIALTIAAKWIIIGRRTPGNYDWDKSSYCQRWQLFLKMESLRRHSYGNQGILGLLTGTYWIVLYFRALGANIGNDCSLFSSGNPSLMFTEPDLLTLGDRVSVDDASLVGHINTRGKFDLNPLFVGSRCVLRSGSRLLSGAKMEEDTCLLEHTLVMAGDIVDAGSTVQGWPAEEFTALRMPTLKPRKVWAPET